MKAKKANPEYGHYPERGTLHIERLLPGPVDRVWSYLTDPEKRATWFAGGPIELKVGGKAELHFDHTKVTSEPRPGKQGCHEGSDISQGHVTRCEPPRLLAYTWWEDEGDQSEIIFELTPQDDKVLLSITHRRLSDRKMLLSVSSGWHAHLMVLEDRLLGREAGPFWTNLAQLKAEYEKRMTADAAPLEN